MAGAERFCSRWTCLTQGETSLRHVGWWRTHSTVAKAQGLSEDMINDLFDYAGSKRFSEREKAALHYAELFKRGEHAIDKDQVYTDLAKHFSDEEIIELGLFCAEVDGVGKFVKSLNVLSWEEACELNPKLKSSLAQVAAE
jgi:hypothetical protein